MPRSSNPTNAQRAASLIDRAQNSDADPEEAAVMRQEATVLAMLAIADEVGELRGYVDSLKMALEDQSGFGVGIHLHYISDWLKQIAERS